MNFLLKKLIQQTHLLASQLKVVLNARSNQLFFETMLTHQNFQKTNLLEEIYHKTFLLQKIQLKLEILSVIFRISGILIGYYYYNSFWVSIVLYSITSVCVNLVLIGIIYSKLNKTVIGHED